MDVWSILLAVIGVVATGLARTYILGKVKNKKVRELLEQLGSIVKTAMLATAQSFVDDLKAGGKGLTPEQKEEARQKTINASKRRLGEEGAKALKDFLGKFSTVEDLLADELEAQIKIHKTTQTQVVGAPATPSPLSAAPQPSPTPAPHPDATPLGSVSTGVVAVPVKNE